jgi:hypothetical protein
VATNQELGSQHTRNSGFDSGMIKSTGKLEENVLDKYRKALKIFDSKLKFHMSVIVEEVLKEIKPVSIYLVGSFGRNEGSLYLSREAVSPLRDYDVLIVVDKYAKSDIIKRIRRNIHKKLGLTDPYSRTFRFKGFTVWITQVTLKDINVLPMLKFYELKEASKLLWGKDIRDNIHVNFENLSAYNGVLILLSKVTGLLGLLNIDELRKRDPEKTIDFVYECMKTYVEMGTCLSLLVKMYEPSFLARCTKLSKNFDVLFPELKQMSTALPSLMVTYAYRRLLIENDFLTDLDLGMLLIKTLRDLKIMVWYYLRKAYEVNIVWAPAYAQVFEDSIKKLNTRVLDDLFDYFMKRKMGFRSEIIRKLAIRVYLRYVLLKFFIIGRKRGYQIKPRTLFMRDGNIMMKLWLIGFTLLESVKEDFNIDESSLYMAADRLCEVLDPSCIQISLSKDNLESRFSYLQKITLDLLYFADKVFHRKD